MRVVALTCSNTEIVSALGCADKLVGVDNHSDFPEAVVAGLPRVGPDLDIDVDRVVDLRPDLVLASLTVPGHERILEKLERAKLPVLAPEPRSLEDVYADIRLIAGRLGVRERAEQLIGAMRAEFAAEPVEHPVRVMIEWWPKPVIVPGRHSWANDVVQAAGGINPLGDRAVKSQPLTDEDAASLEPDVSIISWCGVRTEKYRTDVVLRRPAWQRLELVRERRVYPVPEAWLGRPGPRLVEGVRALRRIIAEVAPAR